MHGWDGLHFLKVCEAADELGGELCEYVELLEITVLL